MPIVVDKDGVIICGHTRLLAAKKLGLREVPVHVADNLTPAQVKAYRLMDNRSHRGDGLGSGTSRPGAEELQGLDFDLALTGFDQHEIDRLPRRPGPRWTSANVVPPVPENPVTRPGDCGSAASTGVDSVRRLPPAADAVARLLGDAQAAADGHRSAVRN